MSIEQLQPATQQQASVYLPYIQGNNKRNFLPFAIGLYQKGVLEGHRKIEGSAAESSLTAMPNSATK
jgi:hypothetical protein